MRGEAKRRGPLGRFWGHLTTITHHKWLVFCYCRRLGLVRQGLCHDLSKYQGNRSPNDAQRKAEGCSTAWLHHKGRNRHHLEYWIDYDPAGTGKLIGNEMPVQSMKDCSVVTATYELGEGMRGTIGIIGPKRMDYDKVVGTLKTLMNQLDTLYHKEE